MKKRPFLLLSGAFVSGEACSFFSPVLAGVGLALVSVMAALSRKKLLFLAPLLFLAGVIRMEQASAWSPAAVRALEAEEGIWLSAAFQVDQIEKRDDTFQCCGRGISVRYDQNEPDPAGQAGTLTGAVISIDNIDAQTAESIRLGDVIRGKGTFRLFDSASNPGQFDARKYYKSLGLEGRIFLEEWEWIPAERRAAANLAGQAKQAALRQLEAAAGEDSGLLSAILTGEKDGLSEEDEALFQNNGISHIYAVSGLHISFIGWGLYQLLKRAGGGPWLCALVSGAVLGFFVLAVGDSASVIRSYVMFLLSLAAGLAGRTSDMPINLAAACAAVLWERPLLLAQPGFQLSFCAVGGIAAASAAERAAREKRKEQEKPARKSSGMAARLRSTLVYSLWVQLALLPSTLWHFFQFPCYGILLNLVVIPQSSAVMSLGFLGLAVSFFWMEGGRWCLLPVRGIFWLWRWLCRHALALPGALWVTGRPKSGLLLLFCCGLLLFCFLVRKWLWPMSRWYLPGLTLFLYLSAGLLARQPERGVEIFFLDVGQGDGVYIREEGGHTIMIDGGSSDGWMAGENRLIPAVRQSGADGIDDWFLSHPDKDHMSGLEEALAAGFPVRRLWIPLPFRNHEQIQALAELAAANGTRVLFTEPGEVLSGDGFSLTCLHPAAGYPLLTDNDGSMVLKLEYDGVSVLLTGDVEMAGEQAILEAAGGRQELMDCQILKVAHHGSSGSSGADFLKAVSPELAVISCGRNNAYGHPHQAVVERLEAAGCRQVTTAEQGAVIIRLQDGEIWLRSP